MLDIRLIRENPDAVKAAIATLFTDAPIDELLAVDADRRAAVTEVETLKAQRNEGSKRIPQVKDAAERTALVAAMRALGDRISTLDERARELDARLEHLTLLIPNMPLPEVPVGETEESNVVTREEGSKPQFDFTPKPHWELAEALGIIDFERGVKISGSRFYILRGDGARLQRALITWMLDLHTQQHGYLEIYPPLMVQEACLYGTGQLPKFGGNLFRDVSDDRWLIPTAEVPVTNMYRDEILEETQLPVYNVAYSACFRREQISAGRDVRGIKRGYIFDKVEMVKFVHPDASKAEHARLIEEAADVLRGLGLPFRHLQICTGDLSFTAANKVDLETWAAGSEEWLEVSSCSNFLQLSIVDSFGAIGPGDGDGDGVQYY